MNNYSLETVPCPLCQNSNASLVFNQAKETYIGMDEYFDVVRCNECDLTYTNPRPTPETIKYFYPDSATYYQSSSNAVATENKNFKTYIKQLVLSFRFNYPREFFGLKANLINWMLAPLVSSLFSRKLFIAHTPLYKEEGHLLDIGCATGEYLKRMNSFGWTLTGIEPNAKSLYHVKAELPSVNLIHSQLENLSLPSGKFDVVHMSMVLEHLHNPRDCLIEVSKSLKPDGQLIISVPSITGIEFKLFGAQCYALQVPQHLTHFSAKTLKSMLNSCGFKVEKNIFENVTNDYFGSLAILERSDHRFRIFPAMKNRYLQFGVLKPLILVLALLGKTSRMTIYAKKNNR